MKAFMGIVAIILATIGLIYAALYELFDGLSTARVAGVVLAGIVALAAGILLTLVLVNRLLGRARITRERDEWPAADEYTTLPAYKTPRAQLPPPQVINVPTYHTNGQAQPYNMPAQPIPILRTVSGDAELSVPLNYLQRFAGLATPSRSEWSGKTTMYSQARAFFMAHGLLDGAGHWRAEYPLPQRQAWLEQFEGGDR